MDELGHIASQGEETKLGTSTKGMRGGRAPPPQVPNIDALLGDIYELRYQVSQLSAHMYQYKAKRDIYHQERDEAQAFAWIRGTSTSTMVVGHLLVFIQGILQQRDYNSSIMQTWQTEVPPYVPGMLYLVPPITYIHVDVSFYQAPNGAQQIASTQGRVIILAASHSYSRTSGVSSQHLVGSYKIRRASRVMSPVGSMGTTHPRQGKVSSNTNGGEGSS